MTYIRWIIPSRWKPASRFHFKIDLSFLKIGAGVRVSRARGERVFTLALDLLSTARAFLAYAKSLTVQQSTSNITETGCPSDFSNCPGIMSFWGVEFWLSPGAHFTKLYQSNLLKFCSSSYSLRSCSNKLLQVPRSKLKSYGNRRFSIAGPKLWNSIPTSLRNTDSLNSFKKHSKTYLFHQAFS